MSTPCEGCRTPLRADMAFCTGCGRPVPARPVAPAPAWPLPVAPPPLARQRSGTPAWLVVVGAAFVAAAAVVAGVLVAGVLAARTGTAPAAAPPPAQAPPVLTVTRPPSTTTPARPEDALLVLVRRDRPVAESTVGLWVPQVSSKTVGTVDAAGVTYDHPEILANHLAWVEAYPDAVLVRSNDYSSFRSSGYWVTLVPRPFSDAAAANRWCEVEGLSRDDCFAKRLSHSDGPDGNTEPR